MDAIAELPDDAALFPLREAGASCLLRPPYEPHGVGAWDGQEVGDDAVHGVAVRGENDEAGVAVALQLVPGEHTCMHGARFLRQAPFPEQGCEGGPKSGVFGPVALPR